MQRGRAKRQIVLPTTVSNGHLSGKGVDKYTFSFQLFISVNEWMIMKTS